MRRSDTRNANRIRGRNGIRCIAVSSPGQASGGRVRRRRRVGLRFPEVREVAGRSRRVRSAIVCSQRGECAAISTMMAFTETPQVGRLRQRVHDRAVVPERAVTAAFEMRPEVIALDAVAASKMPGVVGACRPLPPDAQNRGRSGAARQVASPFARARAVWLLVRIGAGGDDLWRPVRHSGGVSHPGFLPALVLDRIVQAERRSPRSRSRRARVRWR